MIFYNQTVEKILNYKSLNPKVNIFLFDSKKTLAKLFQLYLVYLNQVKN